MKTVKEASGLDPWTASPTKVKKALIDNEQVEVEPENMWRISYLEKLLRYMQDYRYRAMENEQGELQELINSLVV